MEKWKDIKGYEGVYKVSSLGRIKSLKFKRDKILKQDCSLGYCRVTLSIDGRGKNYYVHKLVAIAFLNHKPCGFEEIIDHINENKRDNRIENLQITNQRHNISKAKSGNSKHTGVCQSTKEYKKKNGEVSIYKYWIASITINKKQHHLGTFKTEQEAANAYNLKLQEIC